MKGMSRVTVVFMSYEKHLIKLIDNKSEKKQKFVKSTKVLKSKVRYFKREKDQ